MLTGGLVKKILESKKEYAQSEQQQSQQTKTKIDKSSVNDATRHKEKEMVRKEVCKTHQLPLSLSLGIGFWNNFEDFMKYNFNS